MERGVEKGEGRTKRQYKSGFLERFRSPSSVAAFDRSSMSSAVGEFLRVRTLIDFLGTFRRSSVFTEYTTTAYTPFPL